ncbi:probable DNA-directed RNA polymerase [Cornus florida]|uniref:probable DNA-directed RNA polymerase n=1 Tax=Cornus florida TaxID=4283 RepID=UPI00289F8231|nr:probable DNA-directed RNA polymerase [Cornus florida]
MYNRFRFFTSTRFHDFFIKFNDPTLLCSVFNQFQAQPFQICKDVLDFIDLNRDFLVAEGLLMNGCLANVNLEEASRLLRHCYFLNEGVQEVVSFHTLSTDLSKRVQRARYESFVLTLARAYAGYQFYLPAFMDFRGRMYRAGVSHFHQRDLAKCLICFASNKKTEEQSHDLRMTLEAAAAFKFQKFQTVEQASLWYREYCQDKIVSDKSLIVLAKQASDPFQFLGKVLADERDTTLHCVPVTQDASASAYQIMSYLLLNKELGMHTNLLPSPDNKIQDFYAFLKDELLVFLHSRLNSFQYASIESGFTREIAKLLYMPLIYGKTVIAMASDIRQFKGMLSNKESYHIAQLCKEFWSQKYPDIVNLMKLLNLIGSWCAVSDLPVLYSTPILATVQDYRKSSISEIWVYNRISKKRCRVSLTVPTVERDSRKTQVATCMNFIHQKDAYIAMKVVEQLQLMKAPICTVHDNFLTTAEFAAEIPTIYTNVFMEMGHPFKIINSFLVDNINSKGLDVPSDSLPLPGDYIRDLLRDLVKNVSPKDKKWDQKIEETVTSYLEYVRTVFKIPSGCEDAQSSQMKWDDFNSLLKRCLTSKYKYSVHF